MDTEFVQVLLTQIGEISDPVSGINKLGNLLLCNVHHFQQVILILCLGFVLWELWWIAECLQFVLQFDGGSANWHTCAMETEWEQYVVPIQALIPGVEIALGH